MTGILLGLLESCICDPQERTQETERNKLRLLELKKHGEPSITDREQGTSFENKAKIHYS